MAAWVEFEKAHKDYWKLKGGQLHPNPALLKPKHDRLEAAKLRLEAAQKGVEATPE